MLKNIKTAGELQDSIFMTGEILTIDHYLDSCSVSVDGSQYSNIPIFYHCNPDAVETNTGAIKGGSWGFAIGDKVVVLVQSDSNKKFVIGHQAGTRPCSPCLMLFSTESGEEAIVWDMISDVLVVEKTTYEEACLNLSDELGVSNIAECVNDITFEHFYSNGDDQYQPSSEVPVLINTHYSFSGSEPYPPDVDLPFVRWHCTVYLPEYLSTDDGWLQPFFINPVEGQDTSLRVGMWLIGLGGHIDPNKYWNDDWKELELTEEQQASNTGVYPVTNPDGDSYPQADQDDEAGVPQQYFYFRSIFDYKFNGSYLQGFPSNLLLGTSLMYDALKDGDFGQISEISRADWIEAGYTEAYYDYYINLQQDVDDDPLVQYDVLFPHQPLIDVATGLATSGKSSLLFEWAGLYPNAFEWAIEEEGIWDADMLLKYKQQYRFFFRHPYFKQNIDKVLFNAVNELRQENGSGCLEYNENSHNAAKIFAKDMAQRQSGEPAHIGSDGSKIGDRADAGGYGFYSHGFTFNQEPLPPELTIFHRVSYPLENVAVTWTGFKWPNTKTADATNMEFPETITSIVTELDTVVEKSDGYVLSHDKDGDLTETSGEGWKQSAEHFAALTYPSLLEGALCTEIGEDGDRYISNTFGFIGYATDTDSTNQSWAGFASFDGELLFDYIMNNFEFSKENNDEHRIPKIYLCTIGE